LQPVIGSRAITVVKPALFIKSSDSSTSWPVSYTAEDSNEMYGFKTITSSKALNALTDSEVSYYLDFVPDYLIGEDTDNTLVNWTINGSEIGSEDIDTYASDLQDITLESDNRMISFATGSAEGQSYDLGASLKKYWGDDEKKIIYNTWGVVPETVEGETSINLATTTENSEENGTYTMAGPGQILAAVGTHLPHYAMYVLRLFLTIFVMFFLSIGFYGLTQRVGFYEKE
jgi:hypothetical protein